MASASVRLFVYGSLKRGGRHHDELAGASFLGFAETIPGYRLEPLGEYLALVRLGLGDRRAPSVPADESTVQGELFELPMTQLPALDAFEGDSYVRGEVQVRFRRTSATRQPAAPNQPNQTELRFALAYFKKAR